jgi:hypothetical protein
MPFLKITEIVVTFFPFDKKKQQNKSEREIQGKLINLNKQYILNPSDSLNKDMEKTEMELNKS